MMRLLRRPGALPGALPGDRPGAPARRAAARAAPACAVELEGVGKTYRVHGRDRTVLSDVNARFLRGQAVGILGRNGAGKSTLTRVITGVEHPTRGRVRRHLSVSWPLGFSGAVQASLTGADNTRFIARIYGAPVERTLGLVEEFAELKEYFRLPVKTYSSGMMARLSFALSLAVDFDCYVVDEVIAVGDARFVERCRNALLERRQRSTLLMVSHQVETIRAYCDSGAVLHDGTLTVHEDLEEAIAHYHRL
ncbi:ABC transporter ATP-binding protein [Roseomonas sp. NAR14]|uniref:ABC transporter ATP-binding protein n=1 Tax=Roseomonas acroporae TaxID=2937791 RepID=A0A9X1Y6V4_9PROT|nr:ABC transporter ATP-binding protein [Roseomonas acroporae]MCK8784596.1 ABC transporter ATP-binding protein [Roseomonas acroporae]